ncbi:exportin-6-B-like isoform X3 [Bacillus rossius redtenbacheri]|uniref:exportin-6-B-like isoform X3 n=1 Tax=Bacillus rossius redtenbacheri TaxID=93214 RepID=UPI002FDD9E06
MASDMESLAGLEALLGEFFAPGTSNARKREIEGVLGNFSCQQGAWKHCLFFLSHSSSEHVSMYSLTTIENLITKQWLGLMWEERAQLKAALYQLSLESQQQSVPAFIRNKLVKLVVDIARLDWPHFYPDFFTNILQLIQSGDSTALGLLFLLTASEELVFPWENLSVARKEELRRLLLAHMPQVFTVLTGLLESMLQKQRHHVTATPPPSPTHGQPNASSPVHTGSLLSSMLEAPKSGVSVGGVLDVDSEAMCCLALRALTHLFMWVPINSGIITPALVAAIFRLATVSPDYGREENHNVRTLAMAAINELLYKNCVPSSCADFVLSLLQQAMLLLHHWLQAPPTSEASCTYESKLIEFLQLFVNLHLHRLEEKPQFPVATFAELLLRFTFHGDSLERLLSCLEVWETFLHHLQDKPSITSRYSDVLVSLLRQVLNKCLFCSNQAQLEELDDEDVNDDNQTEWQQFLCTCVDIIDKIISLIPASTYKIVYETWQDMCNTYTSLDTMISSKGQGEPRKLCLSAEHDICRIHCVLRDLSSLTQIMGQLSAQTFGDGSVSHAQIVVPMFIELVTFSACHRLHHITAISPVLKSDFVEVYAQVLAALKSWCHWVRQGVNQVVVSAVVDVLTTPGEPTKLCHSAAHLLATLTSTVRPPRLWELEAMRDLYHSVHSLTHLPPQTHRLVQRALCAMVLLPWPGVATQEWDQRHKLLLGLLEASGADLGRLARVPEPQAGPAITSTLHLLGDMVEIAREEGCSASRKMLYSAIHGNIQQTLELFPQYVHSPEICEAILNFFLAAFSGLTQQLGASFTEHAVHTCLVVFTRDQVRTSLGQEGGAGTRVIEKFLQLLQLVMAEPGAAFKSFVPGTVALCLDHIYPLVRESELPDVKLQLFAVLHAVLVFRWQHFYRSSVLEQPGPGADSPQHRDQLLAILQAYGRSLLQPDINVFAHNLRSLEQVNAKWRLYHKPLFKEELLSQFLSVLLHALLDKSHALLGDDIAVAIHNMATVDFAAFHGAFVPHFLQTAGGLDEAQRSILQRNFKRDSDLPSFTQNILRLMNDLRCYRLCNASLPAGSVRL